MSFDTPLPQVETDVPIPVPQKERAKKYNATPRGQMMNRRRSKRYREQTAEDKYLSVPFVAWDGEGVTREDGTHDYVLFASSDGDSLTATTGHIPTATIFEFVLEMARSDAINVIYGASYDWNCWCADLTQDEATELYQTGELEWEGFKVKWRPGKQFSINRGKRTVVFYDVVSFFQTTFVNACDQYLGDTFEDRAMIVENKMLRSSFRPDDLREIARYNAAELRNLVALMNELRLRLHRAGIDLSRWTGPGIVASTTMKNHNVDAHLDQKTPNFVREAAQHAYFGGRFEVVRSGHSSEPVWEYDLNSAYPWALQDVPSLDGARWDRHAGEVPGGPFTLYHVRWTNQPSPLPQPFPCRYDDYSVAFPYSCEGWYWKPEVDAAKAYSSRYGGQLEILETITCAPRTDYRPFAYIGELYERRRELKTAGDGAHVAYKLSLNSHYGKLCQQLGARQDSWGGWHIPPWHQIEWAGYITSKCRATVLMAALENLESVVAWETDALFVSEPLNLQEGSGLGEWEGTKFDNLTYLQSGTYFGDSEGKAVARTRGVDRGTLERAPVLDAFKRGESHVDAKLTRFITLGAALQGRWDHWRRWETADKRVALSPIGKRMHIACQQCENGEDGWHNTIVAHWAVPRLSKRYDVIWEREAQPTLAELWRLEDQEGNGTDD